MNHKDILQVNISTYEMQLNKLEACQRTNPNWEKEYYPILYRLAIARVMLNEVSP